MEIREDGWLAGVFGHPVFRLELPSPQAPALVDPPDLVERIRCHAAEQAAAFYYTKLDTADVAPVRRLAGAGFAVVDVNVLFELDRPPCAPPAAAAAVEVGDARSEDHQGVRAIAESAFRYSRFHLDPHVPTVLANRIKGEWVASYLARRRGDRLLVARADGRPAGFLAALTAAAGGARCAVIDLIAVAREHQRRGIGEALVAAFVEHYRPRADSLQVGTQVANTPSTRFYERLGFSLRKSQYVLHLHVRAGRPLE